MRYALNHRLQLGVRFHQLRLDLPDDDDDDDDGEKEEGEGKEDGGGTARNCD